MHEAGEVTGARKGVGALAACLAVAGLMQAMTALAVDLEDTRLLSQPAVSDRHLAFAYAGDLWVAQRDGSGVRRLTSHEGEETSPRFSPDGQLIAFTGEYDGNADVYLVPVQGGVPERLTWHPTRDLVQGFTPDGQAVLFASPRSVFTQRHLQLFTVPIGGGFPTRLPIPSGLRASYSPDGGKLAYIPVPEVFDQWKHYRGGTTSRIWIYDTADHSVQQVPQPAERCNDTDPTWIGERVYFRSDRGGELNLFSFEPGSGATQQHTRFADFPIQRLSGSRDALIFEQAGYLHLFDPAKDATERLRIGVSADLNETRPRWVEGAEWIRSADLSPSGARAAFEFRGEVLTLPAKKGDQRNLTQTLGAHERSPVWSPDGTRIAYFSDDGGEYRLHIAHQDGKGEVRRYELGGHGFYEDPKWSPDGRKLSFVDNSWTLYWLALESGKVTEVGSEYYFGPGPIRALHHSWSPDSRWLAYTRSTPAYMQQVFLYDTEARKSHPLTDGLSEVAGPEWDPSGKYLYFLASTDAGPVKHWFAMSNADVKLSSSIYLAVLREDLESPLAPESDEEGKDKKDGEGSAEDGNQQEDAGKKDKAASSKPGEDGEEAKSAPPPEVRIDFDRIDQRIVALPLQAANYTDLQIGAEGKLYVLRRGDAFGSSGALITYDLGKREETELLAGVDSYQLSGDGKKILYRAGEEWGIADSSAKIDRAASTLATAKLQVHIDPRAEWQQMFDEVWRINRDYFYDPNMHGADWQAMGEKYAELLPHLATRADLNRVLVWMCSELAVGHGFTSGGDQRVKPEPISGGLLGADYEIDRGRYRFAKIYGGLNWNPELRAPLTEPGVAVEAGEYLLAVEGVELTAAENLYRRFENTAGKILELEVGPDPTGKGSRTVRVVPIEDESALRNRDWVEGNLRRVEQATDGRVAYVYVPNTTNLGHTYFKRYFFPQVDKQALIIDERFNGGGQVADYYIDHLRRPYISHWATRYGHDIRTPSAAILGPKVMIIDETAGSGGDLLPWMFHKLGLGTLVGKRTWGGLVGILGFPVLMDGGFVTAPNLAIWTDEGFVVENEGVPPDVEVEQWPDQVIAGHDPQLEKAIELVLEELERNPPAEPVRPPFPVRAHP